MNFFDDCDLILKIHYDHFFKGLFDEHKEAIWTNLDKFYKICEQNLTTKEYGYVQAIHHQLISDGYLSPIGDLNDLTHKTHRVTPKGFAFVLNGAYKQQVKSENQKLRLNQINSLSGTIGWIVAAIFGTLTVFKSYQDDKKNDEITSLKKEISRIQSKEQTLYKKYQPDSKQLRKPKQMGSDK